VFRSIGYKSIPMSHTPFDRRRGVIPNENGRVNDSGKKRREVVASGITFRFQNTNCLLHNYMNRILLL